MKILIYTPPSDLNYVRIGRCGGVSKSGTEFPPIKLMYLSALAREKADLLFIDADAEGITSQEFLSKTKEFKPDLIVLEPTPSSLMDEVFSIKEIKNIFHNVKSLFIGPFATAVPRDILEKYKEVDYIIEGEAERILSDLIDGKKDIKGLYCRNGKNIEYYGQQEPADDLDGLPFPAHDLIGNVYVSAFAEKSPFTMVETSRGCPYSCIYCNAYLSSGKKTRFRSVENIIEELKVIKSLGFKGVYFNDETFTLNKKRLKELLQAMIRENLDFTWTCNCRVDTVNKEILDLMRSAGCCYILYGMESGNQQILDYYKKNIKLEDAVKAFKLTRRAGIKAVAHFMIGAPSESWETVNDTIDFAKKINPDMASFNLSTPYPGTEFYNDLKSKGLIDIKDWTSLDQSNKAVFRTDHLSDKELEMAMKKAYREFYFRPGYVISKICSIRSFYDLVKSFKGFFRLFNLSSS